ncbi:LLM class flavin-dependent oxidoreductase [Nocardioides marmoriginsengisoli]|uniref:LLM class flavin-dependent oxidoreductase n=1 Tax=Nocardioides marmoriginsengisoli TaxID=661483 RepID=A0A3N0CI94_9ACTN|nr:LLM class flavin-dependent oxidoreductase [Nocardioides marmoriginsengisoli]RNL63197.1 LLM class flavin-dependent oxidoreductase [Nocardioides marmoriginsengisoli]
MTAFVTRYDFRAPGEALARHQEMFARCLEQASYLEEHGQDAIVLSEHHATTDGYLPSPLLAASAVAARTRTVPISVAALLANLYDPIRLAEDIAVLDQLSGGRVSYTIGLGYRPEEYAMFGAPWETRGADIESAIGVLRQAWTGEPFDYRGRTVRVLPTPYRDPVLFYGGGSKAAARRAARLGLHFQPQAADPSLKELYQQECRALGREPGFVLLPPGGPATVFCSEDPDRFWAENGAYLLAEARGYNAWQNTTKSLVRDASESVEEMRAAGVYVVETPDDLIAKCLSREIRVVSSHPLCGGLPTEPSWESLRLVCETVMPAVKAARAAG